VKNGELLESGAVMSEAGSSGQDCEISGKSVKKISMHLFRRTFDNKVWLIFVTGGVWCNSRNKGE
jgi:hypothetical protein